MQAGGLFTRLTFGSSQHKAKTFTVFLLQQHRLLLDYIVTGREDIKLDTRWTNSCSILYCLSHNESDK